MTAHSAQWKENARRDAAYERRAQDTANAVAYSTSLAMATLKATWRMMRERKAASAKLMRVSNVQAHVEQPMASAVPPTWKGVKRYRAMSAMGKQAPVTLKEQKHVVPEHITAMGNSLEAGAVVGTPIGTADLPGCGNTVIGVRVSQPMAGNHIANASEMQCGGETQHPADIPQPGHRDCPIEIDDSDATTLADSDQTDTDSDLEESGCDDSMPRAAIKAQRILEVRQASTTGHDHRMGGS